MSILEILKKKTDADARILSVEEDSKVNPAGSALSGMSRNGQALQLGGTEDRYQVQFELSDGTIFQTTVIGKKAEGFIPGTRGVLTYRGNAIVSWKPAER